MFWFGFAAHEQVLVIASPNAEQAQAHAVAEPTQPSDDGSISDHHLDDQPAQVQVHAEAALDLPGLLTRPDGLAVASIQAWLRSQALEPRIPPYLDGPQRPPRAGSVVA